jgi:molecular chaperone GrpE
MAQNPMKSDRESASEQTVKEESVEAATAMGTDSLEAEFEKLRQQLAAKEEEAKNNYDRFLRQVAELENFKKRTLREKDEAIRFANETLIKDLLPVLDNLERAVSHAGGGGNGKPLLDGVEMVLKGLLDVLNRYGLVQISAKGQPFDPEKHEAMAQVESEAHDPNTVIEEHHKGYLLSERLLRPALVTVAKAVKSQEKKNAGDEVENNSEDD